MLCFAVALVWDTKSPVRFPLPFKDKKIDVDLEGLLPRIAALAETSIDRKTKVHACEALQGLIVYMVAKQATDPNRGNSEALKMHELYKRLFPVLLRLAVDVEQVAKQIFAPLVHQLIHWLTTKHEDNKDTEALLNAATEAVGHPTDGALREFSAQCLGEFVKWALKHAPAGGAVAAADKAAAGGAASSGSSEGSQPMNVRSLLRRVYGLAHHPSAYKRLGACMTFNQIYRHFRESRELCSRFTLDILHNMITCLQMSDRDDPSLGTRDEARKVISHFERIVTDPSVQRYRDLVSDVFARSYQLTRSHLSLCCCVCDSVETASAESRSRPSRYRRLQDAEYIRRVSVSR